MTRDRPDDGSREIQLTAMSMRAPRLSWKVDLGIAVFALALAGAITASTDQGDPPAGNATPGQASLSEVLSRAGAAAAKYGSLAAVVLAEEDCVQTRRAVSGYTDGGRWVSTVVPTGSRRWKAELAVVETPTLASVGHPWVVVRDVYEVDGRPLGGHADRLARLFVGNRDWRMSDVAAILQESARFNIGPVERNFNTPELAVLALHPANQQRFSFQADGESRMKDVRSFKVSFVEQARPTLIRAGEHSNEDAPLRGTVWLDLATGEVLQSELVSSDSRWRTSTQTAFEYHRRLGMRLPSEMREKAGGRQATDWVEATYRYSNFRRFETAARLIPPK
jgi:hypothetical protein